MLCADRIELHDLNRITKSKKEPIKMSEQETVFVQTE